MIAVLFYVDTNKVLSMCRDYVMLQSASNYLLLEGSYKIAEKEMLVVHARKDTLQASSSIPLRYFCPSSDIQLRVIAEVSLSQGT